MSTETRQSGTASDYKTDALASLDDAFNATEDAMSLLRKAGYLAGGAELASLKDALQQLRYVRRAL